MPEFEADVLVVGGGLAGCWAAYRASMRGAKVILVEKGAVGTSGCSAFAAGDILWWTPEDDMQKWLNDWARWGGFLLDPAWFERLCRDVYRRILEMEEWGTPFEKDEQGSLLRKPGRGHNAAVTVPGLELMKIMREKAVEAGALILDRVMVTELVVLDNRVAGAAGFHVRTGEFHLFRTSAVIMAAGGCSWKGNFFGQDMVCGEAYALAYEKGAQLMSMEYANCYNTTFRLFDVYGMSRFCRLGGTFTNALGERFMPRYDPELGDGAHLHTLVRAMAKETHEGRGPLYFDLKDMSPSDQRLSRKMLPMLFEMFDAGGIDPFKGPLEWIPGFVGAVAAGAGLRLVDSSCSTSVEGLFAAGDAACEGLVIGGVSGPGGINLSWAIITGYRSGEGAAVQAKSRSGITFSKGLASDLEKRAFRFGRRQARNGVRPQDAYLQMQEIVIGWDKSIVRHEARLNSCLKELEKVRVDILPRMYASDSHQLMRAHEAEATSITTEIVLRSALFRKESRAAHYREDYPETDNVRWWKWLIAEKGKEEPQLTTVDVPVEDYRKFGVNLPAA